jgi:cytochrome c
VCHPRRNRGGLDLRYILIIAFGLAGPLTPVAVFAEGNVERGAEIYRSCGVCHALEPGLHLTGPSLAGVWNRPAGEVVEFGRYSAALQGAGFLWDASSLNAWLENPSAMIEGTSMTFRGIPNEGQRMDLIAFLERAGTPGGSVKLIAEGIMPATYLRGQAPRPIVEAPDYARVSVVNHCGDNYIIKTADGASSTHWEQNIRLKIDSTKNGPPIGIGVILPAGMQGDRFSIVFASVVDLQQLVSEDCETK